LKYLVIGAPLFGDAAAEQYLAHLRKQAPPGVTFTGWVADPVVHLDLLIVPSIGAEAITRVVPEAWAAGVPVVASNLGGLAEIIDDNQTGFLVEPDSPEALAARIREVLALPQQRLAEITAAGRRRYEGGFTRRQFAEGVITSVARIGAV
jgi:glycosyltransferase involved in cell wall biosynthesis